MRIFAWVSAGCFGVTAVLFLVYAIRMFNTDGFENFQTSNGIYGIAWTTLALGLAFAAADRGAVT